MRLSVYTLFALGLCGCSLLAPSREEISGKYGQPSSGGASSAGGGAAGTSGTAGATGTGGAGTGGTAGATGTGGAAGTSGASGTGGSADAGADTPCVSPNYICFEAESGNVVAPMATASDPTASAGEYVVANANEAGSVTWTFQVKQAGTYVIWCRVIALNDGTDSFYVSMDGSQPLEYDIGWLKGQEYWSPNWEWTEVDIAQAQTNQVLRTFQLSAGTHVLEFDGREMGSKVDRLIITSNKSFTPP